MRRYQAHRERPWLARLLFVLSVAVIDVGGWLLLVVLFALGGGSDAAPR